MSRNHVHFVYFIDADDGMLKVGMSDNPAARLSTLQGANPHIRGYLGLLKLPTRDEAREVEAFIHSELEPYLVSGEWFRLPPKNILRDVMMGAPPYMPPRAHKDAYNGLKDGERPCAACGAGVTDTSMPCSSCRMVGMNALQFAQANSVAFIASAWPDSYQADTIPMLDWVTG